MNIKAKSITKFTIMVCIIVIAGMFIYYRFMSPKEEAETEKIPTTEIEKLIARDLEEGYPETPKEVLNTYLRYVQCIYNNDLDEEQLKGLMKQLRVLYHSELLANNKEDNQFTKIKAELDSFSKTKTSIVTATLDNAVKKKKIQGKDCALILANLMLGNSDGYLKAKQRFVLANEDGNWKILGFQKVSEEAVEAELTEMEDK